MRTGRSTTIWLVVAVVAALIVLAVCGLFLSAATSPGQPVTCATYQDTSGVWREQDGEPVDADPCDTDDLFEMDHPKVVKTTKAPAPKPSKRRP